MPTAIKRVFLLLFCLAVLALFWRYLIHHGILRADVFVKVSHQLAFIQDSVWGWLAIILVYIVLLSLMFPLTLLVAATGMLFNTEWALSAAIVGSLGSSAMGYIIGHRLGREAIEKYGGARVRATERFIQNNSIRSMVLINLLPIAPFTVTNMLAGAFHMNFYRYMLGSALGLVPGLIIVVLFGGQLANILKSGDMSLHWPGMTLTIALAVVFVGLLWWLNKRLKTDR